MAAAVVTIKGGDATVKLRSAAVAGILDAVTLGIYGCFWWYFVNRELADLGRARGTRELGDDPRRSLLALVPGILLIVPAIATMWNTPKRVIAAQRLAGYRDSESTGNVLPFVLFLLIPPVGIWYLQRQLNGVWAREAEGGGENVGVELPAGAPSQATRG